MIYVMSDLHGCYDKFKEMHLTPVMSDNVKAPLIAEAPVSIECRVKQIIPLGSHDMFLAEVVSVQVDEQYLDPQTGAFRLDKAKLLAYNHGHYYKIGDEMGKFGWSVQKKKNTP